MKLGSVLVILLSLLATAFSVMLTAVGWIRILFYTGWVTSDICYPASALFYIALLGFAFLRCRTLPRASAANVLAFVVGAVLWVLITALDQAQGGVMVGFLTNLFGMKSLILEETSNDIMAVSTGVVWPAIYLLGICAASWFLARAPRTIRF